MQVQQKIATRHEGVLMTHPISDGKAGYMQYCDKSTDELFLNDYEDVVVNHHMKLLSKKTDF